MIEFVPIYVVNAQIIYFYLCRLQILTFSPILLDLLDQSVSCSFRVKWKVDTGKCVDASPLLVEHATGGKHSEVVYIGSHSGWFFAIEFTSGNTLWKTLLNDRIESSACVSACGHFVIVGKLFTVSQGCTTFV